MARFLALVALAFACDQGRRARDVPAPAPPARDAALADVPTIDARVVRDAAELTITDVPDFGCLVWSPARRLVACVIGTRSVNRSGSDVALVFASLRDDLEPGVIPLLHDEQGRGDQALPAKLAREVTTALDGFTPLDHVPATLAWELVGDKLRKGPAAAYVDAHVQRESVGASFAVKYYLSVSRRGESIDDRMDTFSGIAIHVFTLDRSTIIEETWSTGDEGEYSTNGNVWVCRKTCVELAPS